MKGALMYLLQEIRKGRIQTEFSNSGGSRSATGGLIGQAKRKGLSQSESKTKADRNSSRPRLTIGYNMQSLHDDEWM